MNVVSIETRMVVRIKKARMRTRGNNALMTEYNGKISEDPGKYSYKKGNETCRY